jgi:hypothetical protein
MAAGWSRVASLGRSGGFPLRAWSGRQAADAGAPPRGRRRAKLSMATKNGSGSIVVIGSVGEQNALAEQVGFSPGLGERAAGGGQGPGLPVAHRVEDASEQLAGRGGLGDVLSLLAAAGGRAVPELAGRAAAGFPRRFRPRVCGVNACALARGSSAQPKSQSAAATWVRATTVARGTGWSGAPAPAPGCAPGTSGTAAATARSSAQLPRHSRGVPHGRLRDLADPVLPAPAPGDLLALLERQPRPRHQPPPPPPQIPANP